MRNQCALSDYPTLGKSYAVDGASACNTARISFRVSRYPVPLDSSRRTLPSRSSGRHGLLRNTSTPFSRLRQLQEARAVSEAEFNHMAAGCASIAKVETSFKPGGHLDIFGG